jgi:sugar O-acyltransferase (sialic acid O-acetyltransferase NeuD family)
MLAERIVLVGAGDHGRGVLEILRACQRAGERLDCVGFVDDRVGEEVGGCPCLGNLAWLEENLSGLDAGVTLALASPESKRAIAARLDAVGARYRTIVHPRAEVSPTVDLGSGTIVGAGAVMVYDTRVGSHVTINLNATVGHHVEIGDFATIAPGANILGKVSIGEGAQVHANAVVLPSVRIGKGAVVGAGSVVLRDLEAGVTVFGNPARSVPVKG